MITWALAAALALSSSAPATAVPAPTVDAGIPSYAQVMELPPALRARLHAEVIDKSRSEQQRLEKLVEFMFDKQGLAMVYRDDATNTVGQAFLTHEANCLSFTLLFMALAREAKLEVYAQEIEQIVAWRQEKNTVYRSNHVNAGAKVGERRFTVDVASDSVIARRSPMVIDDQRLLVNYYNNRAAELVTSKAMAEALAYTRASLALDPTYATSWSNAGVTYLRSGDLAAAERAYKEALRLDPKHPGALFNMVGLYIHLGDRKNEYAFRRLLEKAQLKDPFHQFLLAMEYEKQGDYALALRHYQRAISLYDGEHKFHFGLARSYLHLGNARRAGRALARAQALSDATSRGIYQAKLEKLKRLNH